MVVNRRKDVEEIDAEQDTHGATRAMQHLLLLLPLRDENWFHHLIRAMQVSGYQHIVSDIYSAGMT